MLATSTLSDWAVVAEYLDDRARSGGFINPMLFNELRRRGMAGVINDLGPDGAHDLAAAKATAYARLKSMGKVYGDDEIDEVAHHQRSICAIQRDIAACEPSEFVKLFELGERLLAHTREVSEYFRRAA